MKRRTTPGLRVRPVASRGCKRLTDRRHPDTRSKAPHLRRAPIFAGPNHGIEGAESTLCRDLHVPARCGKSNSEASALEDRDAKLILESANAAADRGGFDAQRLRRVRKAAGFDCNGQIAEIYDIHPGYPLAASIARSPHW
jgi:hypothetical protein